MEPTRSPTIPPMPRAPITKRSAPRDSFSSTVSGRPVTTAWVTSTSGAVALARATASATSPRPSVEPSPGPDSDDAGNKEDREKTVCGPAPHGEVQSEGGDAEVDVSQGS